MKANELMIGNWVKCGRRYMKVTQLAEDMDCDDIEPIPLAPEILEKNGIKLEEVGDNGVLTSPKWRNRFEKWVLRTLWRDTFIWYDRTAKYWHLQDMGAAKLLYVHQLQNALRLCGIEKEIEL